MFRQSFEKIALTPATVQRAALSRAVTKRERMAARNLADDYRLFKAVGTKIKPSIAEARKELPKMAAVGAHISGPMGGLKNLAKPTRVTPTIRPGNPVFGQQGITGAPAQTPFARIQTGFGTVPRKGLVSRTAVSKGPK